MTTFATTGFTESVVTSASGLTGPTAMEFSPTGELFVLEQGGAAKLVRADGTTFTALSLTVDSGGERGLLGIAFDPSYDGAGPNTDYVYLYYTSPRVGMANPPNNQISRYEVTGADTDTPIFGSPTLIRELPPEDEDNNPATDGDSNHNGGAIHFGTDGKLYVAVGDHNYDPPVATDHPSQKTDTPFGKILRLNPDGSNPTDTPNPFFTGSTSDWQGSIWALGLRNPFTFAVEPGTGRLFINDVGEGTWEEINLGVAGANYGWAGSALPLEGFETSTPWTNYHDPQMAYDHSGATAPSPSSSAIAGGVFYPVGGVFGSSFAGKYFYADLGGRYIRVFDPENPGSDGTPDTSVNFATALTTSAPVDLKVDAAGNLYYIARGGTGEVYRISANNVAAAQLFYNESAFDGDDAAIGVADDGAIAVDKSAYLPGAGLAGFESVSSYARGINGLMIDLAGGGTHGSITANDFVFKVGNSNSPNTWGAGPAPAAVSVRLGAGVSGSDRVEITWASGAIVNTWLEVQVLANARTGLPANDVFFFGSLVGDTGSPTATSFTTTTADASTIVAGGLGPAGGISNVRDIDKSNTITVAGDRGAALANVGSITRLNVGTGGPFAPQGDSVSASAAGDSVSASAAGDAGIASALAAAPRENLAAQRRWPVTIARSLATATPARGAATSYAQLLTAVALEEDDDDEARVDDDVLEALADGIVGPWPR
ncbi:MAG: sorbosone dehydrogenase family protein [Pirellulales bacterium]